MKSDHAGVTVGSCLLQERLASGGFGTVYRAFDSHLNVERAVKVIHPHVISQKDFRDRFLAELRISASLDHPNIVRVLYAIDEPSVVGYVMEFVPGPTLRRRIREGGALPAKEAVDVLLQVARAVQSSQERRPPIIHRDLTPENVMVRPDGVVKVMDYGIAAAVDDPALAVSKSIVGKPRYMPAEQFEGEVTGASDIYALGVILHEALTGAAPFDGANPMAIYRAHVTQAPPLPSSIAPGVPRELDAIVLRALAKDPADRWPDAGLLVRALEHVQGLLAGRGAPEPPELARWLRPPATIAAARVPTPEEQARVETFYSEGFTLLSNQNYAGAVEKLDQALKLDPAHFESRRNRRVARIRQLEVQEGRVERSRQAELEEGLLRHGATLFAEKRWEEAAEAFDRVLVVNPDRIDARRYRYEAQERAATAGENRKAGREKAAPAIARGRAAMAAGQLEAAAAAFIEALAADPMNDEARRLANEAGSARIERAAARQGLPLPVEGVVKSATGAAIRATRAGLEAFATGDFTGAAGHFAEALRLDENRLDARAYLDRCRSRLTEIAEARQTLERLAAQADEKTPHAAAPVSAAPGATEKVYPSDMQLPVLTPEDLAGVVVRSTDKLPATAVRRAETPAAPIPADLTPPPTAALPPLPFVGRANTIGAMDRALDEIPRGKGDFLLLRGKPGVGKSRLLAEFTARHSYRNAVFGTASCSGDLGDYFGPWKTLAWTALSSVKAADIGAFHRLALKYAADLGRFGDPFRKLALVYDKHFDLTVPDERIRTLVVEMFAAVLEVRPLIFAVDALDLADSETLAVLERLAALARERPLILLGAVSQSRASDTNPWARFYPVLRAQKLAHEFLVPRLPEDEFRKLLGPVLARESRWAGTGDPPRVDARLSSEISRVSEGDLQAVMKTCRHLLQSGIVTLEAGLWTLRKKGPLSEDDLTLGLSEALFARFKGLNSRQAAVVRWLSIADDGVPFDALVEVAGLATADLYHALHELGTQKLVAESDERGRKVLAIPSPALRQKVAGDLAAPERTSMHDRLAAALDRLDRARPDRCAAIALRGSIPDRAVDACLRAADAAIEAARPREARDWLEKAEPWLSRSRNKGHAGAHAERMGRALLTSGLPELALRSLQAALAATPPPERPAALRLELARCHLLLGRRREASDALGVARDRVRDARDEVGLALLNARLSLFADDLPSAVTAIEAARPRAEAVGLAGPTLEMLAVYRFTSGDLAQAESHATEALERGGAPEAMLTLARCQLFAGKSLTVAARLESALEGCGDRVLEAELRTLLAIARAGSGRGEASREQVTLATEAARVSGAPATEARAALGRAAVEMAADNPAAARDAAARALELFDQVGLRSGLARANIAMAEACAAAGDPARALSYCDLAAAGASTPELVGLLHLARAEAIFRVGKPAEARAMYHDALRHFGQRWKDSGLIARAFMGLATIHAAKGDRDKAIENLGRALKALGDTELALPIARARASWAAAVADGAVVPEPRSEVLAAAEDSAVILEAAGAVEAATRARATAQKLRQRAE